ncbi:LCP family protein [Apilactobacillus timberlakei]|uniref:Uncharacterized protein n=1 Tax=Apilactobacillus timberlakei TaxID=2008380 RepID=A0ABY2YUJ4_9LACO|nr:hypothetical protein [Apilactobacillus timberlakei]TPR14825.1 hypothetical protein DYZ97_01440 [Apilactobacillus timberlakei]TPR15795.1 hypothetical protein DY052_04240 [Apilactobacillus timberlakei]TPR16156.1 hypothetical protein DY048_01455 [Apilactobacillus timberlakei]
MNNEQNMHRNNKKKMSTGKKIFLWIISIIVLIVLALGGLFAYAYHNVHEAYNKTYKKAQGTTKPKGNKYHMVVKVKGTKKDGSDDKLLYVTGTNGKRDFQVKKLQNGTYTEKSDGQIVDNKSGQVLGNSKNTPKKSDIDHATKGFINQNKTNDRDQSNSDANGNHDNQSNRNKQNNTSEQDIKNAKQQTNGPVNYYTSFDMSAAARAVNALGGLDVDGQHMNGDQVVQYYESGHSAAIMSAAMNRKNDIKALVNQGFLNGIAGGTHTNVTWDQAKQMVK